jgi:hypothetical protein
LVRRGRDVGYSMSWLRHVVVFDLQLRTYCFVWRLARNKPSEQTRSSGTERPSLSERVETYPDLASTSSDTSE